MGADGSMDQEAGRHAAGKGARPCAPVPTAALYAWSVWYAQYDVNDDE